MAKWLIALIAIGLASSLLVAGCGGDDDASDATTTETPTEATTDEAPAPPEEPDEPEPAPAVADPGLPDYTAGFRDGVLMNAAPIPPNAGAPHGDTKNVYVNQARETLAPGGSQAFPYPEGTVVVKTGSRGGDEAAIIAAMRKVQGSDAEHGDWIFEEFSRGSADEPYSLLASDASCWTCHAGATDNDWVFTALE